MREQRKPTINEDAEGNKLTFTVTFDPTAALQVTGIAVTTQPAKLELVYRRNGRDNGAERHGGDRDKQ